MANGKYDGIWKLLSEFLFDYELELSAEFLCVICKSILKNPYQSPCGCRFCMECIVNYFSDKKNHCPGPSDDCKEQPINFNEYLQVDYVISRKISQLKVRCPKSLCKYTDELRNIENHINSHKRNCPYFIIGCQFPIAHLRSITDHLNVDIYEHGKLLADSFMNLKNEVASLALCLQLSKTESEKKDNQLIELENRLSDFQESHRIQIQELKETIIKYKENDVLNSELRKFKSMSDISSIKKELSKSKRNKESKNKEKINSFAKFPQIISSKLNLKTKFYAPFEFQINDFRTRPTKFIISTPFYSKSNGYKLCLSVHPNGTGQGQGTHMSVYIHIMSGEFDNYLDWPMKLKLRICLVDQLYGNIYVDRIFKYATSNFEEKFKYDRPLAVKNFGIGDSKYIQLNDLYWNSRIYQNDSIILKCYVG